MTLKLWTKTPNTIFSAYFGVTKNRALITVWMCTFACDFTYLGHSMSHSGKAVLENQLFSSSHITVPLRCQNLFMSIFCSLKEESDDEEEREKGTRYLLRRWVGTQDKEWLCWPVRRGMSFHHWGPMREMSQGWGTKRLSEEPEIQAVIFPFLKVTIFVTGKQSQYGGAI